MFSRARISVLFLLLLLAAGFYFIARHEPEKKVKSKSVAVKPGSQTPSAMPRPRDTEDKPASPKPIRFSTKGNVRLKPGETAVLSYWEIAPGMNGIALVTPETMPDGNIKLTARILNITDKAVERTSAQDMFPDIFDMEHYGAVGRQRLGEFLESIKTSGGADAVSMPTILTRAGMQASIGIGSAGGDQLSLALKADPLSDGGFDLGMDLNKQGTTR